MYRLLLYSKKTLTRIYLAINAITIIIMIVCGRSWLLYEASLYLWVSLIFGYKDMAVIEGWPQNSGLVDEFTTHYLRLASS